MEEDIPSLFENMEEDSSSSQGPSWEKQTLKKETGSWEVQDQTKEEFKVLYCEQ
jgi:hypothetical protein